MYSLPIALAVVTLIIGVATLTAGSIARLPIWLRIFDLAVGTFMSLYALWALFWVDETVKVTYPTILYVLPFMAVILSILYNYGRISWGIKNFEQTLKVTKTRKPKKFKSRDKEQVALESAIAAEEDNQAILIFENAPTVEPDAEENKEVKTPKKVYIEDDGKPKEFKLPELF